VPSAFPELIIAELDEDIVREKRINVSIKRLVSDQLLVPSVFLVKRFKVNSNDLNLLAGPCHT